MRYITRMLVGLILAAGGFVLLWYGSPDRIGGNGDPRLMYAFVLLFAIGFMIGTMGLLGAESDYPALLSSFVLYVMVGALVAIFHYSSTGNFAGYTLDQIGDPAFWFTALRYAFLWPLEVVATFGLFGITGV